MGPARFRSEGAHGGVAGGRRAHRRRRRVPPCGGPPLVRPLAPLRPRVDPAPHRVHPPRGPPLPAAAAASVGTIGHSTRPYEAFLCLLRGREIDLLADVRHFPSSERVPWSNGPRPPAVLRAPCIRPI